MTWRTASAVPATNVAAIIVVKASPATAEPPARSSTRGPYQSRVDLEVNNAVAAVRHERCTTGQRRPALVYGPVGHWAALLAHEQPPPPLRQLRHVPEGACAHGGPHVALGLHPHPGCLPPMVGTGIREFLLNGGAARSTS